MKIRIIIIFITLTCNAYAQNVIFLHHSTGGNVYHEGQVAEYINTYNQQHQTNINITEKAYPNDPWPWENYPYDYWKLWIDGSCENSQSGIECLSSLAQQYDVIIFKHCFPGAGIKSDKSNGDITSSKKTLPNYKLQYRALRELFDTMPDTKFIAWTLAPLHQLSTNKDEANRAREFVEWVNNEWLTEDGKEHPNIFVFDFFSLAAELDSNSVVGKFNCLKYEYEGSHSNGDSHPNKLANETIGPIFGQEIVEVALAKTEVNAVHIRKESEFNIFPNKLSRGENITVKIKTNEELTLSLFDINGRPVLRKTIHHTQQISTGNLSPGIYLVTLFSKTSSTIQKLLVK